MHKCKWLLNSVKSSLKLPALKNAAKLPTWKGRNPQDHMYIKTFSEHQAVKRLYGVKRYEYAA